MNSAYLIKSLYTSVGLSLKCFKISSKLYNIISLPWFSLSFLNVNDSHPSRNLFFESYSCLCGTGGIILIWPSIIFEKYSCLV